MHTTFRRAATRPAPSTPHLIWRALAALLMSTVLIGTGSAAHAHDTLTDSSPAEGETLTEPLTQVQLTFSAEVLELGAAAVVTDSDGATWETGELAVDGTGVTVPLAEALPSGSYEVSWRVTSSDGHPISGVIPFTVDAPAAETTEPAPADATPSTAPADSAPTTVEESSEATESTEQPEPTTEEAAPTTAEAAPTTASEPAQDSGANETESDDGGVPWTPIVIGLVVLLAALGVFAVVRRRGADQ
ncbi:copper resistance protein CopC [Ornithinimicrobium faecis]|uniref:Copper resistance protein CopC n=1 Tax=Ornithinimicrobium faecis TaxID=2934158 RepID=A0ABY4YXE1_9MICO|nr:copper resistance protein CopC [Ornithinimicrobium sp. HY1793]USQ81446.1 copper resistance protein CopC [Ornithinimicrobium sp. HY1793]